MRSAQNTEAFACRPGAFGISKSSKWDLPHIEPHELRSPSAPSKKREAASAQPSPVSIPPALIPSIPSGPVSRGPRNASVWGGFQFNEAWPEAIGATYWRKNTLALVIHCRQSPSDLMMVSRILVVAILLTARAFPQTHTLVGTWRGGSCRHRNASCES